MARRTQTRGDSYRAQRVDVLGGNRGRRKRAQTIRNEWEREPCAMRWYHMI